MPLRTATTTGWSGILNPASAEQMWRADALYDVVVVLDYNERPRRRGLGARSSCTSRRPGFAPTEGCIALRVHDLRRLLAQLPRQAHLVVP